MNDAEAAELLKASGTVSCWGCGRSISATDHYCRYCGRGQGAFVAWYYKHWGVILATLGLGPFSLPLVWRSPVISRVAKLVYTIVISAATWFIMHQVYQAWMTLRSIFGPLPVR